MEDVDNRLHEGPAAANPKRKSPCLAPITKSERNLHLVDGLLELLSEIPDSSPADIDLTLNRVIESKLSDEDKDDVIQRATRFASALEDAAKRSKTRRMAAHNAAVWALASELTIKVFSLLDTKSVANAAAACSFFHKCSTDPLCFSNIDLTSATAAKVSDAVASTVIQRAGKDIRSLKLGSNFSQCDKNSRQGNERCILTGSCLSPLVADGGASGALLKKLYLYNIDDLDNAALGSALLACPGLLDFEIVGRHVKLGPTLESVCKCRLLERVFFESSDTAKYDCLKIGSCFELVSSCPRISSLTIRGFSMHDAIVGVMFMLLYKLKYVDFSTSYGFTGEFLRDFDKIGGGSFLECLILRDCIHLKKEEVSQFISAMVAGKFARLRHIDVSNPKYPRFYGPSFPDLHLLVDKRPGLSVIADSPPANARTRKKMWIRWASRKRDIRRGEQQWLRSQGF